MRKIYFATGNPHKFEEAKVILASYQIETVHLDVKRIEIQAQDLPDIASYSLSQIVKAFNDPVFVEDTGLFIKELNGFPGPYSSYVHKTIGNGGIIKLMEGKINRKAVFKTVIAFKDVNKPEQIFLGEADGIISSFERGTGWGYDPIFIPSEGDGRTYAEMPLTEKNKLSHRSRALRVFAEKLKLERGAIF